MRPTLFTLLVVGWTGHALSEGVQEAPLGPGPVPYTVLDILPVGPLCSASDLGRPGGDVCESPSNRCGNRHCVLCVHSGRGCLRGAPRQEGHRILLSGGPRDSLVVAGSQRQ